MLERDRDEERKGVRVSPSISPSPLVTSLVLMHHLLHPCSQNMSVGQQQTYRLHPTKYWIRICILPRSEGDVYVHSILKNTALDHDVVKGLAKREKNRNPETRQNLKQEYIRKLTSQYKENFSWFYNCDCISYFIKPESKNRHKF